MFSVYHNALTQVIDHELLLIAHAKGNTIN